MIETKNIQDNSKIIFTHLRSNKKITNNQLKNNDVILIKDNNTFLQEKYQKIVVNLYLKVKEEVILTIYDNDSDISSSTTSVPSKGNFVKQIKISGKEEDKLASFNITDGYKYQLKNNKNFGYQIHISGLNDTKSEIYYPSNLGNNFPYFQYLKLNNNGRETTDIFVDQKIPFGNARVNLRNGDNYIDLLITSLPSNYLPVNFGLYYRSNYNEFKGNNEFGKKWSHSFEYYIVINEKSTYESGDIKYYLYCPNGEIKGFSYVKKYDNLNNEITNIKEYLCIEDATTLIEDTSKNYLAIRDLNNNELRFTIENIVYDNVRYLKIIKIINEKGKEILFNYNDNDYIEIITNDFGNIVFYYEGDMISNIENLYTKEKFNLFYQVNNDDKELKSITKRYQNNGEDQEGLLFYNDITLNKITQINDIKRNFYVVYIINNNKIISINECFVNGTIPKRTNIGYKEQVVTVTMFSGEILYYVFDELFKLKYIQNSKGVTKHQKYGVINEGDINAYKEVVMAITKPVTQIRNLMLNGALQHSEYMNSSTEYSWIEKTTGSNSFSERIENGYQGTAILRLHINANYIISRNVTNRELKNVRLSFMYRIVSESPNVNISVTTNSGIVNTISLKGTKGVWYPYVLNGIKLEVNEVVNIRINGSGIGIIDFAQMQLGLGVETQYNYVENGYFDAPLSSSSWENEGFNICRVSTLTDVAFHMGDIYGIHVLEVIGSGKVSQIIKMKGTKKDEISIYASTMCNSVEFYIRKIKVLVHYLNNNEYKEYDLYIEGKNLVWDTIANSIVAEADFDEIILSLEAIGTSGKAIGSIYFDGIRVLINNYEKRYRYDNNGYLKETEYNKLIEINGYDHNYKIKESESDFGSYHLFIDDNNNNLKNIINVNERTSISYDYDAKGNCTRENVSLIENNVSLIGTMRKTYENNRLTNVTYFTGDSENYIYDNNFILKQINYCNENTSLESETYYFTPTYELTRLTISTSLSQSSALYNDITYVKNIKNLPELLSAPYANKYNYIYTENNQISELRLKDQGNTNNLATLLQCSYDNKGRLSSQKYGISSYNTLYSYTYDDCGRLIQELLGGTLYYSYEYNDLNQLVKVTDNDFKENRSYLYDTEGNIISIENSSIINNNTRYLYKYDNKGNITNKIYELNNKKLAYQYTYLNDTRDRNVDYLYTILGRDFLLDTIDYVSNKKSLYGKYGLKSVYNMNLFTLVKDDDLNRKVSKTLYDDNYYDNEYNFIYVESANENCQDLLKNNENKYYLSRTIVTWKKIEASEENNIIMKLFNVSGVISVRLKTRDLNSALYSIVIEMTSNGTLYEVASSDILLDINAWNCFILRISDAKFPNQNSGFINLYVNGKNVIKDYNPRTASRTYDLAELKTVMNSSSFYYFDNQQKSSLKIKTWFRANEYIGFVGISQKYLTNDDILEIYKRTASYFIEQSIYNEKTSSLTYASSLLDNYELFTLNNTLNSLKGFEPIEFNLVDESKEIKATQCFEYDNELKRYVYRSYSNVLSSNDIFTKSKLIYNPCLVFNGSISIFFKENSKNINKNRVILSLDNDKIVLYVMNNNILTLKYDSQLYKVGDLIDNWNSILLTWNIDGNIILYLNEVKLLDIKQSSLYLKDKKISIGNLFNQTSGYSEINGSFHTLCIGYSFIENPNQYFNNYKLNRITKEYDAIGRIKKEEYQGKMSLSNTYTYSSNNINYNIEKQKLYTNKELNYKYDHRNRIIEISNEEEFTLYGYNYLGRLEKEYTSKDNTLVYYVYSKNGNITNMYYYEKTLTKEDAKNIVDSMTYINNGNIGINGVIVMEYDYLVKSKNYTYNNSYKDQLNRVVVSKKDGTTFITLEDTEIKYANPFDTTNQNPNTNVGAPTSVGDNYLTWRKGLLQGISKNGNSYSRYNYNNEGIRIRKIVENKTYEYNVEGNKVISYSKEGKMVYFHYDENNQLKGFNFNGEEYLYERDITGTILRIIKIDGTIEVSYRYNGWGEILSREGNEELIYYNPFMYKGYIYDEETGWYYCNSRYYNPKWGRWVTSDDVSYLDPNSINGLNLFAYCSNDPVMYYDPSGHAVDFFLDLIFIGWDIYNLITNDGYKDWKNWAALGFDLLFAALPFVTGGGNKVIKLTNVGDDLHDMSKVTVTGETMTRVQIVSQFVNATDNLYDGYQMYGVYSLFGKTGKMVAEVGGKIDNALWLIDKLKDGYKIVDIGIDSGRLIRSSSYAMEKVILWTWKYRNRIKFGWHLAMEVF